MAVVAALFVLLLCAFHASGVFLVAPFIIMSPFLFDSGPSLNAWLVLAAVVAVPVVLILGSLASLALLFLFANDTAAILTALLLTPVSGGVLCTFSTIR